MNDETPLPTIEPTETTEVVAPAAETATEQPPVVEVAPVPTPVVPVVEDPHKKKWYVVKVQSGREDSIRGALDRRIKLENLEPHVAKILVPIEKVTEVRDGKRRVKKTKKFPGYLFVECDYNDSVKFLFRETNGVGDFVGATLTRAPIPMTEREVQRMLADQEGYDGAEKTAKETVGADEIKGPAKVKLDYEVGDKVKVREGMFANMEGDVKEIADRDSPTPKVKVVLTIWGRPVEVDLEYWQVDRV